MIQTSKLGDKFIAQKKVVEESVMLQYHFRSMGIKVFKPTPIFVENKIVVLNATNTGSNVKKKTGSLSWNFFRYYVDTHVVEMRKIHTIFFRPIHQTPGEQ